MPAKNEIFRKAGVGMEEEQDVPPRLPGAGIHLRGATARRDHHPVAESRCEPGSAVLAAAVDDDHLVAARAQRRERLERGADARRLVQRRDDDRESFRDQS